MNSTITSSTGRLISDTLNAERQQKALGKPFIEQQIAISGEKLWPFTWQHIPEEPTAPTAPAVDTQPKSSGGFFQRLFGSSKEETQEEVHEEPQLSERERVRQKETRLWLNRKARDTSPSASIMSYGEEDFGIPPEPEPWYIFSLLSFRRGILTEDGHPAFDFAKQHGLVPASLYETTAIVGSNLPGRLDLDYLYLVATEPMKGMYHGVRENRDQHGQHCENHKVIKTRDIQQYSLTELKGRQRILVFKDPNVTQEKLMKLVSKSEIESNLLVP
jgi:hypothetical protein